MNAIEWLYKEHRDALANVDAAELREARDDYPAELSMERAHAQGYLDAITNVLNELAGPGEVN